MTLSSIGEVAVFSIGESTRDIIAERKVKLVAAGGIELLEG